MRLRKNRKKTKRRLTPKQQRFVENYLNDPELNATEAARKAGYKKGAEVSAHYNLHKSNTVIEEIEKRMKARAREARMGEAQVLEKLKELQEKTFREKRYSESLKALELLGRHVGMWPQAGTNINVGVEVDLVNEDQQAREVLARLENVAGRLSGEKIVHRWKRPEKVRGLPEKKLISHTKEVPEDEGEKGDIGGEKLLSLEDWPIEEDY